MDEPKEKRKYYKWKQNDLEKALKALKSKQIGLNECSRRYGIPKPTLKRHILKQNKFSNDANIYKGRPTVFSDHIEKQLAQHLLQMENCMFGLTISDVRRLAFQIAEQNLIQHNFNREKQTAGKSWFYKFMRRHPELSVRRPESTSINRVKGFNKENVMDFFNKLEKIVDEKGITANTIFNVDETGVSTVQKKPQKVVGQKGKKQVGSISSGERGVNTTAVCATSASGQYIPPMLIFKRMRMSPLLQNGAPPGSIVTVSESGYINSELFVRWVKHFITIVKPSQENNVVLLLDGHTTHSKNLEAINLARENGIIMLQLPGHTTHRLQPMDVSIFGPLSTYYIQEIETWMRANSGKAVTQYEVAQLFSKAYQRAATIGNAISAFEATGVWPVNRHIFEDHHFIASDTFQNQNDINEANILSSNDSEIVNNSASKTIQSSIQNRILNETNSKSADIIYVSSICESSSIIKDNTESDAIIMPGEVDDTTIQSVTCINQKYSYNKTGSTLKFRESQCDSVETVNIIVPNNDRPDRLLVMTINNLNNYALGITQSRDTDKITEEVKSSILFSSSIHSKANNVKIVNFGASTSDQSKNINQISSFENLSNLKVPIHELSPIPKSKQLNKKKKDVQKTLVLTSTPYKNDLKEAIDKRAAKVTKIKFDEPAKNKSNKAKKTANQNKGNGNISEKCKTRTSKTFADQRKLDKDSDNIQSISTGKGRKIKMKPSKNIVKKAANQNKRKDKATKKRKRDSSDSSLDSLVILDDDSDADMEEDLDDYCVICNGYYYDKKGPKVDWIQCVRCYKWLHDTCSEIPDICPKCLK